MGFLLIWFAEVISPNSDFTYFSLGESVRRKGAWSVYSNTSVWTCWWPLLDQNMKPSIWNTHFVLPKSMPLLPKKSLFSQYLARVVNITTKVGVRDQNYTIGSNVNWGTYDHTLSLQGLLLLFPVNYSSQFYVPVATISKHIGT